MEKPEPTLNSKAVMREDSIFKMLTWNSPALTGMFKLPPIVGEPLQQETHEPVERKVDRFYRLADGSHLHVEHQTSLNALPELAERMIRYRVRARAMIPRSSTLHQVIVFTGHSPRDRTKVPPTLIYEDKSPLLDAGLTFSMPIRDLLVEPISTFTRSGSMDDLMLGLLGPGRTDTIYRETLADRIKTLRGEAQRDAKVKFIAICAIIGVQVDQLVGEVRMWIEEVKDSPMVREIVRIAGQRDIEQAERKGLAIAVVTLAKSRGAEVSDDYVEHLVSYADEDTLVRMMADERSLDGDFDAFVKAHGVTVPGYTS